MTKPQLRIIRMKGWTLQHVGRSEESPSFDRWDLFTPEGRFAGKHYIAQPDRAEGWLRIHLSTLSDVRIARNELPYFLEGLAYLKAKYEDRAARCASLIRASGTDTGRKEIEAEKAVHDRGIIVICGLLARLEKAGNGKGRTT